MTIFSNAIPDAAKKQRPTMPVIDVLKHVKTVHCSLGPIPYDESSNAGNIQILENIFWQQYHLPDSDFKSRLFLIYGDQKTTQRIRSIKQRREQAQRSYDRLQWALPVTPSGTIPPPWLWRNTGISWGSPMELMEQALMWGIEISSIEVFSAVAIAQGIGMARLQSKFEWSAYFARFVFLCAQSHTIDREGIP